MASNSYNNKVVYGTTVLIDLTQDTVSSDKMLSGFTAHDKSGAVVTGNIPTRTSTDLISSGAEVTVPAGYYATNTSKSIDSGSVTQNEPTINSSGLVTATSTVTSGYVSSDTKSNTLQLSTKGTTTYNASTSEQSIASGIYLTGKQTILPITTSNIDAGNIKDGTVVKVGDSGSATRIKNVTGTFTSSSTVSSGQTAASAGHILSGYSAWVDGSEIKGNIITRSSSDITISGKSITIPSGYYSGNNTVSVADGSYSASVSSHSVTTVPVVTGSVSGTITDIGTATKPSGTDGTDYWTITPSGSVTTVGESTAKGKAVIDTSGYIGAGNEESSANVVNITPSVSNGTARYIIKGAIVSNTSGGTSSGTISRGKQIKIGAGYYTSDIYYTAQDNSGTKSISGSGTISVDGYKNVSVPSGSTTTGTMLVSASGLVTDPITVNAGYQSASTFSNTLQLPTQSAVTAIPSSSEQTIVSARKYTTGAIKVAAIPSYYKNVNDLYPVGSVWATEDSTADPATVLGIGTWTLIAPANASWGMLYDSDWTVDASSIDGIYVYRRTA